MSKPTDPLKKTDIPARERLIFALDVPEISKGAYKEPESQSSSVHAGMWSGTFTNPREWRAANQQD